MQALLHISGGSYLVHGATQSSLSSLSKDAAVSYTILQFPTTRMSSISGKLFAGGLDTSIQECLQVQVVRGLPGQHGQGLPLMTIDRAPDVPQSIPNDRLPVKADIGGPPPNSACLIIVGLRATAWQIAR